MKWFNSKFQEVYHNPSTFHCNVSKDFRIKTILLGDMMETSNKKSFRGFNLGSVMRAKKPRFIHQTVLFPTSLLYTLAGTIVVYRSLYSVQVTIPAVQHPYTPAVVSMTVYNVHYIHAGTTVHVTVQYSLENTQALLYCTIIH